MADIFAALAKLGINKKIVHGGKGEEPNYQDGTKINFHYNTTKCDEERTVIDDSRNHEKPMELILGKKFKLEIWEVCLKTMRQGEVAEFTVNTEHLSQYPLVSKSLRGIFLKDKCHHPEPEQHCCGMMGYAQNGLGYPDLDDLMKNPQPLIFIMEILKIERLGEFEKENWTLSDEEKVVKIPKLKEDGNALFKQKKYLDAALKYGEAIGMLEQLILKEKPGDDSWEELEDQKTPFLLNFSQCKLCLGDYYPVIEHTTTVLKREPDNVKALYRRAKAHVGAWNPDEAKTDFKRVVELDPSLTSAVNKELKHLDDLILEKEKNDKEKLKGLFKS